MSDTTTFESYPKLATFLRANMETITGDNGEDSITRTKSDCPGWARDLIYSVRADNGEIYDALSLIADAADDDDLDDIAENAEADVYTSDLLAWLSADISRVSDVDEVVADYGWNGLTNAIGAAQAQYRENLVRELYSNLVAEDRVKSADDAFSEAFYEELETLGHSEYDAYDALPSGFVADSFLSGAAPADAAQAASELIKAEAAQAASELIKAEQKTRVVPSGDAFHEALDALTPWAQKG